MRSDNNISVQAILKRFALIYLPIIMVLSVALLTGIQHEEQIHVKEIEEREIAEVWSAQVLVARDLAAVDTDLRIFAKLPMLRLYLDSGNPAQREELEKLFLVLAGEAQRYDQVRYLDASGQEVIRINYNGGKPAIVPREQLQNKSGRYYFDDTFKLNQGEIFVSPLDLNIEHGSLEIPHKPMIRFGTPVFDSAGRKKGIILFNYLGDNLLQHFRETAYGLHDPSDNNMLLNRDGYWLSGTKREDEWGFMLGKKERTFGHDFPDEWRTLSSAERGTLRTDQGLFVYTTVYPLLPKQHSATGSALANAPSQQEVTAHQYQWKIVSLVPNSTLSSAAFYNRTGGRALLVIVYLLLALVAWIIASATLSRKQAGKELRTSEARLALTITSAKLATWDWNIKTGHDIFNERWAEMRGYRLEEIEPNASSWEKGVDPDDFSAMSATLEEHLKGRTPFFQAEYRVRTKSGSFIWILDRGTVFERDADGKPVRMAGIEVDITERKKAEEAQQQSETDLRTLVEHSPVAMIVDVGVDEDEKIMMMNQKLTELFGYTMEDVPDVRHWWPLAYPDEKYREELMAEWIEKVEKAIQSHGIIEPMETTVTSKDETIRQVRISFASIGSKNIVTFEDLTERNQVEKEIRRLNDELEQKVIVRTAALEHARLELEQANRGKDEFLAAISHELKTPLNHILGFADLLKEGLAGELNAEQKGMAQDIFAAGSKQLAIVNSLIELARLQAGKMTLQAEPQDPAKLLAKIATRHAAQAQTVGLAFNVEVAQGLGEMPLDREVVTHLLDQLLENAFKFTPSGGKVSLTARRVPRADVAAPVRIETGKYLELAVADNGPGIAPEILPRLFQPFVQGDGRLARSHGGTGVGLMLVKLLAELHGGGSAAQSEPGTGAKFLVWLPCEAAGV